MVGIVLLLVTLTRDGCHSLFNLSPALFGRQRSAVRSALCPLVLGVKLAGRKSSSDSSKLAAALLTNKCSYTGVQDPGSRGGPVLHWGWAWGHLAAAAAESLQLEALLLLEPGLELTPRNWPELVTGMESAGLLIIKVQVAMQGVVAWAWC